MKNLEMLQEKINDLVLLLSVIQRDNERASGDIAKYIGNKESLVKEVEKLEADIIELKDMESKLNIQYKAKTNELERLENINKGRASDLDRREKFITEQESKLSARLAEFEVKVAEYAKKNGEIVNRQNKAEEMLANAKNMAEAFEKRVQEANIDEREAKMSARLAEVQNRLAEAKNQVDIANRTMSLAEDIRKQAIKDNAALTELKAKFEARLAEVDSKEKSLDAEKVAVAKQKEDVEYRELKVNKIIKEKNLSDLLKG